MYRCNISNACVLRACSQGRGAVQIYMSSQWANTLVYSYPWIPMHSSVLEAIAAEQGGEPSIEALKTDAAVDDVQHAANWEDVITYLTTIDMDTVHIHNPLLPQSP